jgi:hypothetical protein
MDDIRDLSEMQYGNRGGEDLYLAAESRGPGLGLIVRDLKVRSLDQISALLASYEGLDVPKEATQTFWYRLAGRPDSWFMEVVDDAEHVVGIVYLANIILERDADFMVLFWDRKLGLDRRDVTRVAICKIFEKLQLPRLSAVIPASAPALVRFLVKKVGFKQEGVVRGGWDPVGPVDAILLGLLRGEADSWK